MEQYEDKVGNLGASKETIEQYINTIENHVAVPRIPSLFDTKQNDEDMLPYYKIIEDVDMGEMDELRHKIEEFKIGNTSLAEYRFPLQYCWEHLKQDLSMGRILELVETLEHWEEIL